MKRSEMIIIIEQAIIDFDGPNEDPPTFDLAEFILKQVEKAGMKPPWYEPFEGKLLLQWENESEKK